MEISYQVYVYFYDLYSCSFISTSNLLFIKWLKQQHELNKI